LDFLPEIIINKDKTVNVMCTFPNTHCPCYIKDKKDSSIFAVDPVGTAEVAVSAQAQERIEP
jgi:hypothetical protein